MKAVADEPPLWTWAAALLLAAICVGLCWLCVLRFEPAYESYFLNLDRLSSGRGSSPLVVIIGTSKTRCGIEADSQLEARLAHLGSPARVVRFSEGWATAWDFDQLFSRLPSERPALVAIESELVDLEPNAFRLKQMPPERGWRERTRNVLTYLLARPAVTYASRENRDPKADDCGFGAGTAEWRQDLLATRRASTPEERAPYYRLAERLQALNVPVVLLGLPPRHDKLGAKPQKLAAAEQRVRDEVLASGLFKSFGDPPAFAPEEFLDYGHLSPRGRARFSAWLAPRIATFVRRAAPR